MRALTAFVACAFLALAGNAHAQTYTAHLTPAQEVPTNASTASGYGRIVINEAGTSISYYVVFNGLAGTQTASHIHKAAIGVNGAVQVDFGAPVGGTSGVISGTATVTAQNVADIRSGITYINVHSTAFPGGEIRGQLAVRRVLDFDGDGQTDYSVLRYPTTGSPKPVTQYNINSTTGFQSQLWGNAETDFPCPGDYDGDAKDDFCVFRRGAVAGDQGVFYILRSSDGAVRTVSWGLYGDIAVNRDYDGDGITDIAVYRLSLVPGDQGIWWILQSRTGTVRVVSFGERGGGSALRDIPAPEDYDGDGKVDIAVYRAGFPPANTYIIMRSSDGQVQYTTWGNFDSDYTVPRDFDGDGKADFVAARMGAPLDQMVWWIQQTSNGQVRVVPFGISADVPAPGDYDGDGRFDITVARNVASQKTFYTTGSFAAAFIARQWGINNDYVVAAWHIF